MAFSLPSPSSLLKLPVVLQRRAKNVPKFKTHAQSNARGIVFLYEVFCFVALSLLKFFSSSSTRTSKKNRAKTMGLTTKTTSPHVHYILTSLHDLDVKFLDGPFSGGRKHTRLISFLVPAFQPFVYFKSII